MHLARRVAHELLHLLQSAECGYTHTHTNAELGRVVAGTGVEDEFTISFLPGVPSSYRTNRFLF